MPRICKLFKIVITIYWNSESSVQFLKLAAEGREFAKKLRSLEQFVRTVKGQNIFW